MRQSKAAIAALLGTSLAIAGCAATSDPARSASAPASAAPAGSAAPAATAPAEAYPVVGGAQMLPTLNIIENASKSAEHTTLVQAVKAAGLADALSGPGPFTVFAPNDAAFGRLQPGTLDTLLKPENKAQLATLLKFHVLPRALTAEQIMGAIAAGGGTASFPTLQGAPMIARMEGANIVLTGGQGNISYVIQSDVAQSNGVIHVVNGVIAPPV